VKVVHHYNLDRSQAILSSQFEPLSFQPEGPDLTELEQILAQSRAAETFKMAVRSYCARQPADRIRVDGFAPTVKVQRLLAQVLSAEPHLPIERICLRGRSGCSDFVGTVEVHTPAERHIYDFVWDCRWRAEQEGWTDCFGFPDQIRAAREYDWKCFERWERAPIGDMRLQTFE
jgi:hypothetical protein